MNTKKFISNLAEAFFQEQEGKTEEGKKAVSKNLIKILEDRRKDYLLPDFIKELEELFLKRSSVSLFLAKDHDPETIEKVKKIVFEKFGKKNINLFFDEDLIGGFRAKTGNLLIKASVKDFLNDLKASSYCDNFDVEELTIKE